MFRFFVVPYRISTMPVIRDNKIDVLRFIGLSMIILAHIKSPNILHQIRSFDVPLMLFVSGLVSSRKPISNYSSFIYQRVKRLIVPVWIFLSGYFLIYYGCRFILFGKKDIPYQTILESYLFLDGIGYVWVIRIFLIIMLITPLLVALEKRIESTPNYMLLIGGLLVFQGGVVEVGQMMPDGFFSVLYNQYITYIIGYSIPFMLGLRFKNISEYTFLNCSIIFGCVLISIFIYLYLHGTVLIDFHKYKFPPYAYFVVYGSFVSILLWFLVNICKSTKFEWGGMIGKNTIWIYLWHIPFVMITFNMHSWFIRYIVVYISSVTVFGLQYIVVKKLNIKLVTKYFLG